MFVQKIPVYLKIPYTTTRYCKYCIVCDTNVYQRIIGTGINYTWQDLSELNPAGIVNDYLGSDIISPVIEFLSIDRENTTSQHIAYNKALNRCNINYSYFKVSENATQGSGGFYTPEYLRTLNGFDLGGSISGVIYYSGSYDDAYIRYSAITSQINSLVVYINAGTAEVNLQIFIYPDDIITTGFNEAYDYRTAAGARLNITFTLRAENDDYYCTRIELTSTSTTGADSGMYRLQGQLGDFETKNSMIETDDLDNPYGDDGNSYPGGGDGTLPPGGLDSVDPTDVPDIPSVSAANCGFMTIYNPSAAQLKSLSDFLWSGAFDLDTYKKLFSDPMESIIGLAIVPIAPDTAGSKNVTFGSIDSGVSMPYLASQYKKLECGSVDIEKYVGCFMDYSPYTKISIYLPYIGIRDLSPDDITGGSISVTYIVDVLTGACACFISHSSKGVLYSYNGSCISNIPLTAANFSGAIQNAVSAIIGGVGVVAGMATGAAPVTAAGVAGLLNSAANTAINSKPHIQRSGNLGGSAGIMSVQKPFIIIERPNLSVPNQVQHYVGQTSNLTRYLGECSGFTMVEYIHLHNVPATNEELSEIESLLKGGVIL